MEVFVPTNESRPCGCGGRTCRVPSIYQRHTQTKKHLTWEFQSLSLQLLSLTALPDKVRLLLQMRTIVRTLEPAS